MMQATITERVRFGGEASPPNSVSNPEDVVPPEVCLTAPSSKASNLKNNSEESLNVPRWVVVARNRRVNKDWEKLLLLCPENAIRCYEDLCTAPMVRQPKRVFPLRGKRYKGAWEYEITGGERVFYNPDPQKLKVEVYYAGKHPKEAPIP